MGSSTAPGCDQHNSHLVPLSHTWYWLWLYLRRKSNTSIILKRLTVITLKFWEAHFQKYGQMRMTSTSVHWCRFVCLQFLDVISVFLLAVSVEAQFSGQPENQWQLGISSWRLKGAQSWGADCLICGICSNLGECQNRIERNHRTPARIRELAVGKETLHAFCCPEVKHESLERKLVFCHSRSVALPQDLWAGSLQTVPW